MEEPVFFEYIQDFFQQLNPNFCEEYVEDNDMISFFQVCQEFFDQMGPQI